MRITITTKIHILITREVFQMEHLRNYLLLLLERPKTQITLILILLLNTQCCLLAMGVECTQEM